MNLEVSSSRGKTCAWVELSHLAGVRSYRVFEACGLHNLNSR